MTKNSYIYEFTEEEMEDIIENYCIPVWEARDVEEMARFGYVLACIVDYVARRKRVDEELQQECTEELMRILKMQAEADAL